MSQAIMKFVPITLLLLLLPIARFVSASAEAAGAEAAFALGKYCWDDTSIAGKVCILFKADGSYVAKGELLGRTGTSLGTWKRTGSQIVLTPKQETGSLVAYMTRFKIDEHRDKVLTWLPKSSQNFGRNGGVIVYPSYKKVDGNEGARP